jgi:ABC-type transport system involved in multi-copper enzyme maturation permease subunit
LKFLPAFQAFRWLVGDTFRQAWASGVLWAIFAVTAICYLLCLSVSISAPTRLVGAPGGRTEFLHPNAPILWKMDEKGARRAAAVAPLAAAAPTSAAATCYYMYLETHPDPEKVKKAGIQTVGGEMSLAFGGIPVHIGRDARSAVVNLQLILAGGVADALGLLMALVWTAGFMPSFLEPSAVSVLLAKPLPRWALLAGKFFGVIAFVLVNALVFVLGTWFILGLRTAIWEPTYLLCIPILVVHFSIFFSFSTLLAVYTRSPSVCIFGSLAFWFVCWGMNIARHALVVLPEFKNASAPVRWITEAGYWFLPKPADLGIVLFNALAKDEVPLNDTFGVFKLLQDQQLFQPGWSLTASLIFTAVTVVLAAHEFLTTDY